MFGRKTLVRGSFYAPFVGILLLVLTWGTTPSVVMSVALVAAHVVLVLMSVIHAEAIAHRVGEPLGTLVLALAITVIEVSLILTLMTSGESQAETLARDTVFAAIMIVCNGVVGLSIFVAARRTHIVVFREQGANALLGTVVLIATLSLVIPRFTSSSSGGTFTGSQLAFSAVSSAAVYVLFVFVQTVRHRWMFLEPEALDDEADDTLAHVQKHEPRAGRSEGLILRTTMLLVSLAGVVGLAKTLAPRIEESVVWFGAPQAFVGVVIALMVLLPESVTAVRAANQGEMQTKEKCKPA
jgi:Ca2+:H+ antiporter